MMDDTQGATSTNPIKEETVVASEKKHRVTSLHTQEGSGHDIEDRYTIINDMGELNPKWKDISFYGIFDGHGGISAANFISKNIANYVVKTGDFNGDVSKALWDGFLAADKDFLAKKEGSGCCGIAAVFVDNDSNPRVLVPNVGDSRAILVKTSGEAVALSTDHKASNEVEKDRIKRNGGFVNAGRLYGILAVARAFGDKDFKGGNGILIAEPEITETKITSEDNFVLVGCDGLWDVLENQEVADFINAKLNDKNDLDSITKSLVEEAVSRGSRDDITVILIMLQPQPAASKI